LDPYDAIFRRRSCRKYSKERLTVDELACVEGIVAAAPRLYPDIDMRVSIADGAKVAAISKGLVGAYGKVVAPHFLVATSDPIEGYLEDVGYTLQTAVLDLCSQGYGTCWIGGQARRELVERVADRPPGHELVVVIAFGRPAQPDGHVREPGTGARKRLGDVVFGDPGALAGILDAARLAPSAGNTQNWRFVVEGQAVHVFSEHRIPIHYKFFVGEHLLMMNRTDCGIALANARIAAEREDRAVSFERRDGVEREGCTYVTTAVFGDATKR
jgi:nitroreductase